MKRREEVDKLKGMNDDDLHAEAARLKESLFRLNFKLALGEVDAIKKMREEKKALARIRTIVRQREIQPGNELS
jgi:large subunit ribosomal protein L29